MKKLLPLCLLAITVIFAAPLTADAATLKWDHSTGQVNGYRVYLDDMITPVAELNASDNTWALPDTMKIGQQYLLGVSAYNQAGESAKALVRFTYQENVEIELPLLPVNITINFNTP